MDLVAFSLIYLHPALSRPHLGPSSLITDFRPSISFLISFFLYFYRTSHPITFGPLSSFILITCPNYHIIKSLEFYETYYVLPLYLSTYFYIFLPKDSNVILSEKNILQHFRTQSLTILMFYIISILFFFLAVLINNLLNAE